ncbi:hypothetical protein CC80DRAFT_124981 [Byssothecium circinans]|uniref:Uncharacterized protein n=1 Tax=Byssothecium circinans TaxID=147558 RepID=A0A6A5TUH4_9PLEO|nr:hypothetical protein CC80DRAFT_124981 [Byssothecium circinans]
MHDQIALLTCTSYPQRRGMYIWKATNWETRKVWQAFLHHSTSAVPLSRFPFNLPLIANSRPGFFPSMERYCSFLRRVLHADAKRFDHTHGLLNGTIEPHCNPEYNPFNASIGKPHGIVCQSYGNTRSRLSKNAAAYVHSAILWNQVAGTNMTTYVGNAMCRPTEPFEGSDLHVKRNLIYPSLVLIGNSPALSAVCWARWYRSNLEPSFDIKESLFISYTQYQIQTVCFRVKRL